MCMIQKKLKRRYIRYQIKRERDLLLQELASWCLVLIFLDAEYQQQRMPQRYTQQGKEESQAFPFCPSFSLVYINRNCNLKGPNMQPQV